MIYIVGKAVGRTIPLECNQVVSKWVIIMVTVASTIKWYKEDAGPYREKYTFSKLDMVSLGSKWFSYVEM